MIALIYHGQSRTEFEDEYYHLSYHNDISDIQIVVEPEFQQMFRNLYSIDIEQPYKVPEGYISMLYGTKITTVRQIADNYFKKHYTHLRYKTVPPKEYQEASICGYEAKEFTDYIEECNCPACLERYKQFQVRIYGGKQYD